MTSTSVTLRLSTETTVKRRPSKQKLSPGLGMRPSCSIIQPLSVTLSLSQARSKRSKISSSSAEPLTR